MSFRFHLIMVIKFYLVLAFLLKCHGGDEEIRTPDPLLARQVLSQLSYTPMLMVLFGYFLFKAKPKVKRTNVLLRKEVIQPHLPIRLPCYDFTPVIDPTFDCCLLTVSSQASGIAYSHGVTGGVYKTRERIHRSILICDY